MLRCVDCGSGFDSDPVGYACSRCNGILEAVKEGGSISRAELFGRAGEGIWRFRALLPLGLEVRPTSLMEGATPLIKAKNVSMETGVRNLYFKNEGQNPTGSFKD